MSVEISTEQLLKRLKRIHVAWQKGVGAGKITEWGGANALCFALGKSSDDEEVGFRERNKNISLYLLGWEFSDTVMILTESGTFYVLASSKKVKYLEGCKAAINKTTKGISMELLPGNKEDGNAANHTRLLKAVRAGGGVKLGVFRKELPSTAISSGWMKAAEVDGLEFVDISLGSVLVLAQKDKEELEMMQMSSIITSKYMQLGLIDALEDVIEQDATISHVDISKQISEKIDDPSKLKLKVKCEPDDLEEIFPPVIQSGGKYEIEVRRAESDERNLSPDIVVTSMALKYRSYTSCIARTIFIDAPPRIKAVYQSLVQLEAKLLDYLIPGANPQGIVAKTVAYCNQKTPDLTAYLPKTLGYGVGLNLREKYLELSSKNTTEIQPGMTFYVNLGFSGVPLTDGDKKKGAYKFNSFSMVIGDTVVVKADEACELLTKTGRDWSDVSYEIKGEDSGEEENVDEEPKDEEDGAAAVIDGGLMTTRRLRERGGGAEAQAELASRDKRMLDLLKKRAKEKAEQILSEGKEEEDDDEEVVEDLKAYPAGDQYPSDTMPHQIKVDMDKEVVLLPINGHPVPFAIHTIKNVVMPEPDNHSFYLRINFFAPGQTMGKEASRRMVKLVEEYGQRNPLSFIKELTFRSLDQKNLSHAFRQIQELRKRLRMREQRAAEEADLVHQAKLICMTDARAPRLADLTMRPNLEGKTMGALEAHANGLRFTSTKGASVDILYTNIKLCIFQPCEGHDTKVVLHFHLKNSILVGRKAHRDIQVFTEAMDSTVNLDAGNHSHYDPDEILEEQRDRQLKKKLNFAFKDFAAKISKVAQKESGIHLEPDIPYHELGFYGTPHKEMVFIQPTTYALVNVTHTPAFVVPLDDIEHVHFERVNPNGRNFDLKIILHANMKDGELLEPNSINMIEQKYLNTIMGWLADSDITYTQSDKAWNWRNMLTLVREDNYFYEDVDEYGEKKPAGWAFLRMEDKEEGEGEGEDDEESDFEASESEDESEDETDEDESFDDEEDDAGSFDGEEDLEEEGMDWEEMEKKAEQDDKAKRSWDSGSRGSQPKQKNPRK
eukprot:44596_1